MQFSFAVLSFPFNFVFTPAKQGNHDIGSVFHSFTFFITRISQILQLDFHEIWGTGSLLQGTVNYVWGSACISLFTARRSYASAVLGVVILSVRPSVCPFVRPSHACFVTNPKKLPAIFLYHMKGNPSSFLPPNSGWWATSPSTFSGRTK